VGDGTNGFSSVTATFTTAPTAGNLLIAVFGESGNNIINTPSGWQVAVVYQNTSPGGAIFYKIASGSESTVTVTTTLGSSMSYGMGLQLYEYSGMAATSPLDAVATPSSGSGTSLTSGSVTTTQACDLLISGAAINTAATFTWGSSFTEEFDFQNPGTNRRSFSGADRAVTTATSYSASATASASAAWSMVLAAFKVAAATPTPTPTATPSVALVQKDYGGGNLTSSVSATFDATPVAGHLLVAIVGASTASTINQPSGWSTAINQTGTPGQAIFYKIAGSAESRTVTVTVSDSGSVLGLQIYEYSGIATSSPLDQTSSSTGTSTAPSSGSVTTTQANELLVAGMIIRAATSYSGWTNSFNEQLDFQVGTTYVRSYAGADRIVASTGTYSTTATTTASGAWRGQIATFKGGP